MKNTTRIGVVLVICIGFFVTEIAIGFKTKSLALIADAFHYLNDIVAYVIAFSAAYLQEHGQHTHRFTYAFHRAELVGAFFNGVFLMALALSIFLQSIERFVHVEIVNEPKLVLIVGCIGLILNVISIFVVHDQGGHDPAQEHSHELSEAKQTNEEASIHATHNHQLKPLVHEQQKNLGLMGVLIHLLGDAINNIGVIIAALIFMYLTTPKRFYADPAASLLISFIIFGGAIPMTLKSGRILLEGSPIHLDLSTIKEDLLSIPNVLSVHDFHVWNLSQSVILGSLHVCVALGTSIEQWAKTESYLQQCFEAYGINHVTISPEIHRDLHPTSASTEVLTSRCRLPCDDDFGCAVNDIKKRKATISVA